MKTKIIIITVLAIALLSFSIKSKNAIHSISGKKNTTVVGVNKGLVMEDKNQFN